MKKTIKIAALLLFVAAMSVSCCKSGNFSLRSVDDIVIKDMSNIDIYTSFDNNTCRNITVQGAKISLNDNGSALFDIVLRDKIRIAKKSNGKVVIPIAVNIRNPIALLSLPKKLQKSMDGLTVSGQYDVKAGVVHKKSNFGPMPIQQFLREAGMSEKDFKDLLL